MEAMNIAFKRMLWVGWGLAITLIIVWPLLALPAGVFSKVRPAPTWPALAGPLAPPASPPPARRRRRRPAPSPLQGYFTFWVILSITWGLLATIVSTLLPLWESRDSLINVTKNVLTLLRALGGGGGQGPRRARRLCQAGAPAPPQGLPTPLPAPLPPPVLTRAPRPTPPAPRRPSPPPPLATSRTWTPPRRMPRSPKRPRQPHATKNTTAPPNRLPPALPQRRCSPPNSTTSFFSFPRPFCIGCGLFPCSAPSPRLLPCLLLTQSLVPYPLFIPWACAPPPPLQQRFCQPGQLSSFPCS